MSNMSAHCGERDEKAFGYHTLDRAVFSPFSNEGDDEFVYVDSWTAAARLNDLSKRVRNANGEKFRTEIEPLWGEIMELSSNGLLNDDEVRVAFAKRCNTLENWAHGAERNANTEQDSLETRVSKLLGKVSDETIATVHQLIAVKSANK